MSIYDKASLVLIPSGTKTSKVYSQKPVSGDGDFTFSRSTGATRINADGNIEKETQNLLLQSNSFDTTWVSLNTTETGGQAGYDGTNNAWLITKSAASARVYQTISVSGVQTYSVYAKAGTLNWVAVSNNLVYTYFDVANGVIGTDVGTIDSNIESVGGGWYRCSITYTGTANDARIYPSQGDNNSSGTSGNIYIQDAQLEQGMVARDYIETTTAAVEGGITDNVPRLDYTDSSCPALLLEGQRSNLIDYSEYASGNSSANTPTLVENYAISPEGLQNAFQISTDASTFRRVRKILTGLSGNTSYSVSVFVKKATSAVSTYGGLGMLWQGGTQKVNYIIFDEYNGTMSILQDQTSNTATKVDDVGDYWRFSVSATDTGTNPSFEATYYACLSSTGSTIGVGVKSWVGYGLQLEQGTNATSYIPTYGTSVTRNADSCLKTGISSLIGQTEGTLFAEFEGIDTSVNTNIIPTISDGTINNSIRVLYNTALSGITAFIRASGNLQTNTTTAVTLNAGKNKIAVGYALNNMSVYFNGVQIILDTSITIPATSQINLFNNESGTAVQKIEGNQALLFKTRLSNEELAALTTI